MDLKQFLALTMPHIKEEERMEYIKLILDAFAGGVSHFDQTILPAEELESKDLPKGVKAEELVEEREMEEEEFGAKVLKGEENA